MSSYSSLQTLEFAAYISTAIALVHACNAKTASPDIPTVELWRFNINTIDPKKKNDDQPTQASSTSSVVGTDWSSSPRLLPPETNPQPYFHGPQPRLRLATFTKNKKEVLTEHTAFGRLLHRFIIPVALGCLIVSVGSHIPSIIMAPFTSLTRGSVDLFNTIKSFRQ